MPVRGGEEKSNSKILSHRFTNIDQLAEQVQPFVKGQVTQLSVESLHCDLLVVALREVQFVFAKTSCPILSIGEKPRDALGFTCLLENTGPYIVSHNRKVSHQTLMGFDLDRETRMVVPANVQYASMLINRDILHDCLTIMERQDLDQRFWANNYVHVPENIATIKAYLRQLLHLIQHQPLLLQQSTMTKLLVDDFIPLLINAIPPVTKEILQPPSPLTRSQLVKQAEDYMMAHLDQPLTLKDLCEALHSSRTPVFSAFQEVLGVSPMEYLKVQRLQSVRRMLKAASPRTANVTAIARNHGFWSAGHFTRDYKQMFGELPSETLKRA